MTVNIHVDYKKVFKELNAPKARLKLLIALNAGLSGQELKEYLEG